MRIYRINIRPIIVNLLVLCSLWTLGSCAKPRLDMNPQQVQSVAYTGAVNYGRQNYIPITIPLPLKKTDDRSLKGLPTANLLQVNGHLFFSTQNGYLYLMQASDIYEETNTRISKGGQACPTLYRLKLFIPSEEERTGLYVYNLKEGNIEWQLEGQPSLASPVVNDSAIFHAGIHGDIFSLNTETGEMYWHTNIGENLRASLAFGKGRLYAGGDEGTLRCINPTDGSLIWDRPLNAALSGSPVFCRDRLLAATYTGTVYSIDYLNGDILNSMSFDVPLYTQASTDGRIIVIPLSDGRIQAYRFENLNPLWSADIPGPAGAPALITDNCIMVGTTRKHFTILDRNDGRIIQDFELEGRPRSTALVFGNKVFLSYEYKNLIVYASEKD